jgi:hypothetical protein
MAPLSFGFLLRVFHQVSRPWGICCPAQIHRLPVLWAEDSAVFRPFADGYGLDLRIIVLFVDVNGVTQNAYGRGHSEGLENIQASIIVLWSV